jgi:ankyrin repeat protein
LLYSISPIYQKDKYGKNVLHWASSKGHGDIVELLMHKTNDINHKDGNGQTALHFAAENKATISGVKALIEPRHENSAIEGQIPTNIIEST